MRRLVCALLCFPCVIVFKACVARPLPRPAAAIDPISLPLSIFEVKPQLDSRLDKACGLCIVGPLAACQMMGSVTLCVLEEACLHQVGLIWVMIWAMMTSKITTIEHHAPLRNISFYSWAEMQYDGFQRERVPYIEQQTPELLQSQSLQQLCKTLGTRLIASSEC